MLDGLSARPWQIDRLPAIRRTPRRHAQAAAPGRQNQKANLRRMIDRADEALSEADRARHLLTSTPCPTGIDLPWRTCIRATC